MKRALFLLIAGTLLSGFVALYMGVTPAEADALEPAAVAPER